MSRRFLAIQTNTDGRPCGWAVAPTRQRARDEAESYWRTHGPRGNGCYPGEERGEILVQELPQHETEAHR